MRKERRRDASLFLIGDITGQEVHLGSSGDGTDRYPLIIGTYIELTGTLDEPLKGTADLAISVYEVATTLQERGLGHGMVDSVKPVVQMAFWVDHRAADRLVTLVAAKRLTSFHVTIEPPRYGRANVIAWSLRTIREEE